MYFKRMNHGSIPVGRRNAGIYVAYVCLNGPLLTLPGGYITGNAVLSRYVENSLCVSCKDLAARLFFKYLSKIKSRVLLRSSRSLTKFALFNEVRVLLEKYARLPFRQIEFELLS